MPTPSSSNSFYEFYRDFLQQSRGFWSPVATVPIPDASDIWKQFYGMWTAFCTRFCTQSPEALQAAQRLWAEQLDTTSKGLENLMGTKVYGTAVSKFFQEQLAWQEKIAKVAYPQIDGALRAMNLPSRHQIDRLYERTIGMEERLDDLETDARQMQHALQTTADAATEFRQHMATLATQLEGINQRLEAIDDRQARMAQPDATLLESLQNMRDDMSRRLETLTEHLQKAGTAPTTQARRARSRRKPSSS